MRFQADVTSAAQSSIYTEGKDRIYYIGCLLQKHTLIMTAIC